MVEEHQSELLAANGNTILPTTIVEEVTKESGVVRRYQKGRFLGKVNEREDDQSSLSQ